MILTDYEKCIAFKLVRAFRQVVCGWALCQAVVFVFCLRGGKKITERKPVFAAVAGLGCRFDILRTSRGPFVCDVNGFSFVKSNVKYYEDCSSIMRLYFLKKLHDRLLARSLAASSATGLPASDASRSECLVAPSDAALALQLQALQQALQQPHPGARQLQLHAAAAATGAAASSASPLMLSGCASGETLAEGLPLGAEKETSSPTGAGNDEAELSSTQPLSQTQTKTPSPTLSRSALGGRCRCLAIESDDGDEEEGEELRTVVVVMRHGDRRPKQKLKFESRQQLLLQFVAAGGGAEAKLKSPEELRDLLHRNTEVITALVRATPDASQKVAEEARLASQHLTSRVFVKGLSRRGVKCPLFLSRFNKFSKINKFNNNKINNN